MKREQERRPRPVVIGNLIAAFISALVIAGVELGFVEWTATQQASVMALVIAGINLGVSLYTQKQVTPLKLPQDDTGVDLIRTDGHEAVKR